MHQPLRASGLCDKCEAWHRWSDPLGWVLQTEDYAG